MKFVLTLILSINFIVGFSQTYDTLVADTCLLTYGVAVKFKAGTVVKYSRSKRVMQGILAENTRLWTPSGNFLFARNKEVTFNKSGEVLSGTIVYQTSIWTAAESINISSGSKVIFNEKGKLIYGKSSNDLTFNLKKNKNPVFSKKGYLLFDKDGNILQGILKEDTDLQIGKIKSKFAGGTKLTLTASGTVKSGTVAEKRNFKNYKGEKRQYPAGTFLKFDKNGFVTNYE